MAQKCVETKTSLCNLRPILISEDYILDETRSLKRRNIFHHMAAILKVFNLILCCKCKHSLSLSETGLRSVLYMFNHPSLHPKFLRNLSQYITKAVCPLSYYCYTLPFSIRIENPINIGCKPK